MIDRREFWEELKDNALTMFMYVLVMRTNNETQLKISQINDISVAHKSRTLNKNSFMIVVNV